MFRYEMHCHTLYSSLCSRLDAQTMIRLYLENGYDGIVVTDHFLNGNTTVSSGLSWQDRIDGFYKGFELVKEEATKQGLKVFCGLEYSYLGTDFLSYGQDKAFLKAHPEMMAYDVRSWLAFMRSKGFLCVQAHPFREAGYIDHIRLYPSDCEGIETPNSARDDRCNRLGEVLADEYGLLKIGGSDIHRADQKILSGVETSKEVFSLDELIFEIRSGGAKPFLKENIFAENK